MVAQCRESLSVDPVLLSLEVDHLFPEMQAFPHLFHFLEANHFVKLRLAT